MQQKSNCKYISKNFCTLSTCEHYNGYCVGDNSCSYFIKSPNRTIIVQNPHNSRNEEYISKKRKSLSKTITGSDVNINHKNNNDIENNDNDEELEGKSIKGIKNVDKPNLTIDSIIGMWKKHILDIPDFQRKFVWTVKQSSRFIESLLIGVPIPSLMFYKDANSTQLIVDGQQRIKSIIFFIGDDSIDLNKLSEDERKRYKYQLTGLASESKYNGKTFEELDEIDKRKILFESILDINLITLSDTDDLSSIYYLFERINTGGTPLKPQEIRNCICAGKFNEFLLKLNDYPTWRKFFDESNAVDHLQDVELILRFFALYDREQLYKSPMKDYLTDYMKIMKNISDEDELIKEELFKSTIDSVYLHLGSRAFRPNNGINSSVFDSVMLAFAKNQDNVPTNIKDKYDRLCTNQEYIKYCGQSSGDNSSVRYRIQMANDYLFGKVEDINLKIIRFYDFPVSAGYGNFIGDDTATYTEITTNNRKADFAVKITGDSMEPEYHNGDILLVKSQNTLNNGQLGIIFYNGDTVFKKYNKRRDKVSIISLNENKYPPVDIPINSKFVIQGLVLGKITNIAKI